MADDITQVRILKRDKHVVVLTNGRGMGMPWAAGVAFYEAIKRLAAFSQAYEQHKDHNQVKSDHETVESLTIFRTGLAFFFELDGIKWFECPWKTAVDISKHVLAKAREIEEVEKHQQVTEDTAILLRTGLPVGLTDNQKIQKDAWKLAEDVKFPGSVEPKVIFGTPTIIQHPPKLATA